jgi:hypothetical protein
LTFLGHKALPRFVSLLPSVILRSESKTQFALTR